ncbi:MAG: hypothetical protein R3F56_24655 [Planctomycetota bacterium]
MNPARICVWCPIVLIGTVLASCGHGRSSPPIQPAPPPLVLRTVPGEGDIVEPNATVSLELASAASTFAPGDVIVSDGGNALPGTLERVGDTASWTWTPDQELPRGCTLTVATDQQGVVVSFSVRDIALAAEFQLPGETVEAAFCWPNGRRALLTASGRVFEATPAGLVERFVPLTAAASAYGDGDFIDEQVVDQVRFCVRSNLDGSVDRVPTPNGVSVGAHNASGDVVVFVPSASRGPSPAGLWRLGRADLEFTLAGALAIATTSDPPSIEADATVTIAWSEADAIRLARFAVGDTVGQRYALPRTGGTSEMQYDAAADGRGVLAFLDWAQRTGPVIRIVCVARFEPDQGLLGPQEALRWVWTLVGGKYPVTDSLEDLQVGAWGSACLTVAHRYTAGQGTYRYADVLRAEPDGQFSEAVRFSGQTRRSPARAEQWAVLARLDPYNRTQVELSRSRPRGSVRTTSIYEITGGTPDRARFALDDSNRALIAVTQRTVSGLETTVLLWD